MTVDNIMLNHVEIDNVSKVKKRGHSCDRLSASRRSVARPLSYKEAR